MSNPYDRCPVFETEHFMLRLLRPEDAECLLICYADPRTQALFNADNCNSDFRYQTIEEMRDCIDGWLKAYRQRHFIRFAVVDKSLDRAVGTVEMFGRVGRYPDPQGVLRLDIHSDYETRSCLKELLDLCVTEFFTLFDVDQMLTKAVPSAAARIDVLTALGFQPREIPGREHAWVLDAE